VLADGFAASVTILALLLAGAAAANLGSPVLLTAAAVVLIAGSAGFVAAAHRADAVTDWLRAHYPHARRTRWLAGVAAGLSGPRAGYRHGTAVLLLSSMSPTASSTGSLPNTRQASDWRWKRPTRSNAVNPPRR
jgi:hypothetical protein